MGNEFDFDEDQIPIAAIDDIVLDPGRTEVCYAGSKLNN